MNIDLDYSTETYYEGSNGMGRMKGLNMYSNASRGIVVLAPINSKKKIARCEMCIPKKDIPKVIAQLQKFLVDT